MKIKVKKKTPKISSEKTKIVALQRQILVLENLRKKRLQKPSQSSGEIKMLAMGISHEFNNILGAVDGHAEWALDSKNPEDWRSSLEIIRLACQRSSEITSALRGWGQPREEQKSIFPFSDVLAEIEAILSPSLVLGRISLETKFDRSALYGNKTEILEVILNLVKNSIEALMSTPKNTGKKIQIHSNKNKGQLQIVISDNGPGIPSIYRHQVFEPFFTLKGVLSALASESISAPSGKGKGSGLGLFLSRSIIEEHGGNITLQDSDIGTHFKINLPLTES